MDENYKFNMKYILGISLASALGGLLFGYDLLVISGAKEFYQLHFNLDTPFIQGWAVSSCIVGCIIGAMFVGKPSEIWGRTRLLSLSGLFFLISAIGSGYAPTFTQFVLYRLLGGIGMGMASTLSPMYIAEAAPASMRGRFVSLNQLTIVLGILLAQLINYIILQSHPIPEGVTGAAIGNTWNGQTGWRWMFAAEGVPAFIFMISMLFVPGSPRWLVKKGRDEEARKVLSKIGEGDYAADALEHIKDTLGEMEKKANFGELLKPRMFKILMIGIGIAVYQQWCGINVIFNYASDIFKDAGYEVSGILFNLVIIGTTNLLFTFVGMKLVDSLGRKPLMIYGSVGLGIAHVLIGLCYFFNIAGIYVFIFALAAVACFAATLGPVAWVLISELFPNRIRGVAVSLAVLSLWVANFILSLTFPVLKDTLGPAYTFWIYAVICAAGVVFLTKSITETKGKTLEEIELELVD